MEGAWNMNTRIVLSDNLIERINEICKRKSITFEQFCSNAIYNRVLDEEEKQRTKENK